MDDKQYCIKWRDCEIFCNEIGPLEALLETISRIDQKRQIKIESAPSITVPSAIPQRTQSDPSANGAVREPLRETKEAKVSVPARLSKEEREKQIIEMRARGMKWTQIARHFGVSPQTVVNWSPRKNGQSLQRGTKEEVGDFAIILSRNGRTFFWSMRSKSKGWEPDKMNAMRFKTRDLAEAEMVTIENSDSAAVVTIPKA